LQGLQADRGAAQLGSQEEEPSVLAHRGQRQTLMELRHTQGIGLILGQTHRQTDRQADRQTHRKTDRQSERETDRQISSQRETDR